MPFSMKNNIRALNNRLEQRRIRTVGATRAAVAEWGHEWLRMARRMSEGQIPAKLLARRSSAVYRMFARRNPKASAYVASIINRQSGRFYDSWMVLLEEVGCDTGHIFTVTLYNVVSYSGYMRGTKYMIERPVIEGATKMTTPRIVVLIRAVRSGLN